MSYPINLSSCSVSILSAIVAVNSVFADTAINITNLDSNSFVSNVGTASSVVTTTNGNKLDVAYTLNNLDLAEDGTANDSITFNIEVAGSGGTVSTTSGTGGQPWGVNGVVDGEIDPGEGLSFSLISSSVTLGNAGADVGLAFVGFAGVNSWYTNGDLPRLADVHTTVSGEDFGTSLRIGGANVSNTFSTPTQGFFVHNEQTNGNGFYLGNLKLSFKASNLTTLSGLLDQFTDHLNGTTTLTAGQLQTLSTNIRNNIDLVGSHDSILSQAIDAVDLYESVRGNLFSSGQFNRDTYNTVNNALRQVAIDVHQGLIDYGWTHENVKRFRSTLEDESFLLANYFPRSVTPPANPNAVYQVQINADVPVQFGFPHQFKFDEARRPTGAYLAPGSIGEVIVPSDLVGKGYVIRVNAHVFDLSNKSFYKRLDRVSLTFPITSETTEIAHPLGGAVYIEVPYGADDGLQTVQFRNTVRSPFYSNTLARQTSLQEWLDTERHHPGPWADFETDKFMLNVPTDWISNWDNAESIIGQWHDACAVVDDLFGYQEQRSKTTLYLQVDVVIRSGAFSTGYPQSNSSFNPLTFEGGLSSHEFLSGPKFAGSEHLHELGHAEYFTKFNGEVEAAVNLPYVAVHYQNHVVSIDESLGRSVGDNSRRLWSRDQSAIHWMATEAFRNGVWNMTSQQSQYQQRGYADYVELAYLFGWDALSRFWYGDHVDYENGISRVGIRNSDPSYDRIQRMSSAAGVDLNPLMHFWGNASGDHNNMQAWMAANNLPDSRLIYDRLRHYQSVIPTTLAEFTAHRNIFYSHLNATEKAYYDTMTAADGWGQEEYAESYANLEWIINRFFPNGRPKISTYPHVADFNVNFSEWGQQEDDDWDWRLNIGDTPNGASGPSSAPDGSQYLLLRGSDTGQGNQAAYIDCVFDMSALPGAELTFDYHMYGFYIDSLSVDVHDGTQWFTDVWIANGQQHNNSDAAWSAARVPLSAFAGLSEVTVRFRGQKTHWNASDIALDNVIVSEAISNNTAIADAQTLSTEIDTPLAITLTATADQGASVAYAITNYPSNGVLTGTAPDLTYTPNTNYVGEDSFRFTATDAAPDVSSADITINVGSPLVLYRHTAGSTTSDIVNHGVSSSVSFGGNLNDDTIATTIDQLSAAANEGLPDSIPLTDFNYYFSYQVSSNGSPILYSDVSLDIYAKDPSRRYQLSYIIAGEAEVFITSGAVESGDLTDAGNFDDYDFQNFTTDADVEFRVYWQGSASSGGLARVYVDEFRLFGNGASMVGAGLVAHWSMDDGSGATVSDDGNHGFDATQSNASWTSGLDGSALSFNGSSSTVTLPAAAFESVSDQITIAMWAYGGPGQPQNNSAIYAVDDSGNRMLNVHLPWNNGSVYWDAGDSSGYDRIYTSATVNEYKDQWNHWVFTKNAVTGEMAMYLNGVLWHSGTGNNKSMSGISNVRLGSQISGMHYDGLIDDLRLYNVSLDASAIADLFNSYEPVNNAPVANNGVASVNEDGSVGITLSGSDIDGDSLSYAVVSQPVNGLLSGTAPNLVYLPDSNYNGSDSLTFTVHDGTVSSAAATVSITVNPVNDAPVADSKSASVSEDDSVGITLSGSDAEGSSLSYAVVSGPSNGSLSGTAPNLTYTPSENYNGSDSFSYTVNDGSSDSSAATVSITVTAVNDAPEADAKLVAVDENTSVAVTLSGSDIDGDSLSYAVAGGPSNGSLSGTAPNLTYTPNTNYTGSDSFTYTVNDGTVNSAAATVSITVNNVNDAPVFSQSVITGANATIDSVYAGSLSGAAFDADGDSLSYSLLSGPAWLNIATNGTLSGTPASSDEGANSWTVQVADGNGGSDTATLNITVNAANGNPISIHIEAEDYTSMSGIQTQDSSEGTLNVGWTDAGDYCMYAGVDLTGITDINLRTASRTSGNTVEVRIGSATGTLIGTVGISNTGAWQTWTTDSAAITSTSGVHDVYIVFATGGINLNWLELTGIEVDSAPGIRVTEYYLSTGDFAGTEATVTLDQSLATDYFILVRGSHDGDGLSMPNNDYARVTAVPSGAGDLADSGNASQIQLSRAVADFNWEGVVTVVECTNPSSNSGFKLVDILSTNLTGTSGTDLSANWNDVNQVVLFGGYRGGGTSFIGTPTSRNHGTSVYTRLSPSGSNTLNWSRNAGGETLYDAVMTTFVIEWGSDWNVQHVNVSGANGGAGADATAEYATAAISSVTRANTWVWGTGNRADAGIGDSAEACLVTLGDGVNQNTTESTVAISSEYTDAYDFDVYTMTHADLAVDYRFKIDGDSASSDLAVPVDSASSGARFGWSYNGCNGTGTYFPRPRMWARYTADGEITLSRGFSGQNFPAWVQGIDFSGLNQ